MFVLLQMCQISKHNRTARIISLVAWIGITIIDGKRNALSTAFLLFNSVELN
jgi:hypothetical protein